MEEVEKTDLKNFLERIKEVNQEYREKIKIIENGGDFYISCKINGKYCYPFAYNYRNLDSEKWHGYIFAPKPFYRVVAELCKNY